jgi:hypothetical protein
MRIRAAAHIHSEWSYDASWPLEKLSRSFRRLGYDALLMTEHDRGYDAAKWAAYRAACREATSAARDRAGANGALLIPGMEYSDPSNTIHILTWGIEAFLGDNLETPELLRKVRESGGVAVMAHPGRREAWRAYDPAWTEFLLGIELWNRKTDGYAPSPAAARLLESNRALPFAGLDFHEARQIFPLAMNLEIDPDLSGECVVAALRDRRCSAVFLGLSARRFASGLAGSGARAAERARRTLARAMRRFRP